MKKITLSLLALSPFFLFGQNDNAKIQAYLEANKTKFGLTQQDVTGWLVENVGTSDATRIDVHYVKQRLNGIEIFNAISNVWIKNGEVINLDSQFVENAAAKANTSIPTLSVLEGLASAMRQLHVTNPGQFYVLENEKQHHYTINNGIVTDEPVLAKLVYQRASQNSLRLAWDYTFYTPDFKHLWSIRIDAVTGEILDVHDLVVSCRFDKDHKNHSHTKTGAFVKNFYKESNASSAVLTGSYRVIPYNVESPSHGPRQLLASPHDVVASPHGWHDTNNIPGNEYTTTRGNNVFAYEDHDSNNSGGVLANGGTAMMFDFPYGGTNVDPLTYTNASITNLFYMSNVMHDVWFRYGFNEQNGNFQQMNYTGFQQPGFGGDALNAEAQDGATLSPQNLNNANFATPADGSKPRCQMFLWNVLPPPLQIMSPAAIAGPMTMVNNVFSPGNVPLPLEPNLLQADLALYQDALADPSDACSSAINVAQLTGKVAILRRGECPFVEKVLNAQAAGAIAVIVVNNVADPAYVGMSGADASITIPAVFVSQADGEALIARLSQGPVNVKFQRTSFVNADGDFDNGIIAHEYGHGISTRLTGGPASSNCLFNAEAMGEGWSDWFALIMSLKAGDNGATGRGIGTFAVSEPTNGGGIRAYPYSTDMGINPRTLSYSNSSGANYRYDVGEVWATMLWDLTWAYINKYGFDPNIYSGTGGNNKVMRIVLDAMKLQPCSPGFVAGRNAIIAADQAITGGQDFCMIWEVFARRGLGQFASSGSTTNSNDQVQDFTVPPPGPNCSLRVTDFAALDQVRVYPNPSAGLFTIRVNQYSGYASIKVVDLKGRVVFAADENFSVEKTINLSHLQSGMYILQLKGEALNYTQKIIRN
jgi:extracellular elastinolytic metalloproteinase